MTGSLPALSRRAMLAAAAALVAAPRAHGQPAPGPRSLDLYNTHTGERWTGVYTLEDGTGYAPEATAELDWFLRDHYDNVSFPIDPGVYDILWRVGDNFRHHVGRAVTINVHSGFRTEATNQRLLAEGAAQNSLHKEGKAVDISVQGYGIHFLAEHARHAGAGGVGIYWRSRFVHLDTGRPRFWYQRRRG